MTCELIEYCHFCSDNMADMPLSAEYIRQKLCYGSFEQCNRYRMYKQLGGENIDCMFSSSDSEVAEQLMKTVPQVPPPQLRR